MNEEMRKREIEVRVTDDVLMGRYANLMRVGHSADEFVLEFINATMPPKGIMVSRIVISPGHLKRILKALGSECREIRKEIWGDRRSSGTQEGDRILGGMIPN